MKLLIQPSQTPPFAVTTRVASGPFPVDHPQSITPSPARNVQSTTEVEI